MQPGVFLVLFLTAKKRTNKFNNAKIFLCFTINNLRLILKILAGAVTGTALTVK